MKIAGLQKLTLLDYPGKVAATVFTPGCNFRCPFCHNGSLVLHPEEAAALSVEEVLSYFRKRSGLLEGVCITGGEPLLQADLADFIGAIRSCGISCKLDSNGYLPDRLEKLLSAGLVDYVAMDIKAPPEKYGLLTGISPDMGRIRASVDLLIHGSVPYEFRTTVIRELHAPGDFEAIGKFIEGAEQYFLQSYVDSGDVLKPEWSAWGKEEMENFREEISPYVKKASLRGI